MIEVDKLILNLAHTTNNLLDLFKYYAKICKYFFKIIFKLPGLCPD